MAKQQPIDAAGVITRICAELRYSRAHVAKMLRLHARRLGARRKGRFWMIPTWAEDHLHELVRTKSGVRYKLGETGPHR